MLPCHFVCLQPLVTFNRTLCTLKDPMKKKLKQKACNRQCSHLKDRPNCLGVRSAVERCFPPLPPCNYYFISHERCNAYTQYAHVETMRQHDLWPTLAIHICKNISSSQSTSDSKPCDQPKVTKECGVTGGCSQLCEAQNDTRILINAACLSQRFLSRERRVT